MQNQRLPKIAMTKSGHKRERFNFSHDVNTTAEFAVCQPLMCKQIIPGSKTVLSTESLTRLAPMVAPTFGRIKYKMWHQFIELRDICESFDAMIAQEPIYSTFTKTTYKPINVPHITLSSLSSLCFIGARATIYLRITSTDFNGNMREDLTSFKSNVSADMVALGDLLANLKDSGSQAVIPILPLNADSFVDSGSNQHISMNLCNISGRIGLSNTWSTGSTAALTSPLANTYYSAGGNYGTKMRDLGYVYDSSGNLINNPVTPDSADFILNLDGQVSGVDKSVQICFAFSDFGKRLRKQIIGLGYQVDLTSVLDVTFLPFFALYKAYWNIFGLTQWQDWQQTSCAKLIRLLNVPYPKIDFLSTNDSNYNIYGMDGYDLFVQFIKDVGDFFVTDSADFVSAHLPTNAVSPMPIGANSGFVDVPGGPYINNQGNQGSIDGVPVTSPVNGHSYYLSANHGYLDEEYLKKAYRWVNRNTIIGRRIADLLKASGQGKFVDECKTDFIGYTEDVVQISDVVSTADTSFAGSQGASLGEFGGKGVQYTKGKSFTFENDNFGYWITLAAIVPESGYSQQIDGNLFGISYTGFFNPDYDSLGYSGSYKSQIQGAKDTNDNYNELSSTFGFKPRYFEYKFSQNVCNGDMSRRGTRSAYLPYFLDRFIVLNDRLVEADSANEAHFSAVRLFDSSSFPIAGNLWRFITKYPWLGNLRRIFSNFGKKDDLGIITDIQGWQTVNDWVYYCQRQNDDFLIHNIFDMQCYAPMKAVEDSFETSDEDEKSNMVIGKA